MSTQVKDGGAAASELTPIAWMMDDLVCPHRDFTSSRVLAERRAKKPKAWSVKPLVLAEDVQSTLAQQQEEIGRLREALMVISAKPSPEPNRSNWEAIVWEHIAFATAALESRHAD
ncbi:hypothetical protein [Labrys neptuniae]